MCITNPMISARQTDTTQKINFKEFSFSSSLCICKYFPGFCVPHNKFIFLYLDEKVNMLKYRLVFSLIFTFLRKSIENH